MHSPEPWKIHQRSERPGDVDVADANEQCVLETDWVPGDTEIADYDRIVACVNACQGIPTDRLANMDLKAALEHLDNGHGNIDCDGYCPVAKALKRPKEIPS